MRRGMPARPHPLTLHSLSASSLNTNLSFVMSGLAPSLTSLGFAKNTLVIPFGFIFHLKTAWAAQE